MQWKQLKPLEQHIEAVSFPSVVIRGMDQIAEYMQCSRPTLSRWVKELGFPVVTGRNREAYTTTHAVTMWVLAMAPGPQAYPAGGLIRRSFYGPSHPKR